MQPVVGAKRELQEKDHEDEPAEKILTQSC